MNRNLHNPSRSYDAEIDAALATLGKAEPLSGFESRLNARLATSDVRAGGGKVRFFLLQRLGMGVLAAASACGIVIGSVEHSRRSADLPPALRLHQGGGVGGANVTHIPTHVEHPDIVLKPGNVTRPARNRATVSPTHARHANGAAVPKSPYPPDQQKTDSSDSANQ